MGRISACELKLLKRPPESQITDHDQKARSDKDRGHRPRWNFPLLAALVPSSTKTSRSPGAVVSEGIRENWWRQGMMGAIKAHYDCVKVLLETEFYDDLKVIDVPVLVMHGEDDQICPFPTTGAVKLLKNGTLKSYPGLPHGLACHTACRPDQRQPAGIH
jgi:pimeloyl-ACP methyl ester carboxylesterase